MKALLFLAVVLTCSIAAACPPVQLQAVAQVQAVQQYAVQQVQAVAVPVYVQSFAVQSYAVAPQVQCVQSNVLGLSSCNRGSILQSRQRILGSRLGAMRSRRSVSRSRATVIQRN